MMSMMKVGIKGGLFKDETVFFVRKGKLKKKYFEIINCEIMKE